MNTQNPAKKVACQTCSRCAGPANRFFGTVRRSRTSNCIAGCKLHTTAWAAACPTLCFVGWGEGGAVRVGGRERREKGTRDEAYPHYVIQEKTMQPSVVEEKSPAPIPETITQYRQNDELAPPRPDPH